MSQRRDPANWLLSVSPPLCRHANASADEVRWLIRHRSCQLLRLWQQSSVPHQRQGGHASRGAMAVRRIGLAVLALGLWAVWELRAAPVADSVGIIAMALTARVSWSAWIADAMEEERFRAESERREQRQDDIDDAFTRWSRRMDLRPSDQEMLSWLAADRAILLNTALQHFGLKRSKLTVHAFLEERAPFSRAARSEDGPALYERYQILIFLLVGKGVRMVRASLDFVGASFSISERRDFRYDSIVSVRVKPLSTVLEEFELQLASGDPITLKTRGIRSFLASPSDTLPADEVSPLHAASTASPLHLLEGIAAEGGNWLNERTWNHAQPRS